MANLLSDSIDFAAYEQATEAAAKVRRAGEFFGDVIAQFAERERGHRHPTMTSTKVGDFIEFRPSEVTAWTGYNGHKKSLFTSQLALDLCAQSQRVLIASFEMTPAKTLARMVKQAGGVSRPSDEWITGFGSWTQDRLWLFDHIGRATPKQIVGMCRYFADELKGTHVFIDSMMMVCASEEHMDEQKQFVTDLCRIAQETGLHVHLITHCRKPQAGEDKPPSKYDIRGAAAISDQVDNVITVWANKVKRSWLEEHPNDEEKLSQPDALVTVEKQRNGEWEGRLKLWFAEGSLRFCDDRTSPIRPYDTKRTA